ncbi:MULTISPECIES: hypothetical protein [unclassified Ensifer]|uniref:hypothetical protein n=1 Tax=unclassified Ensifer TaxID=2633371 RepID=UPI000709ADAC|nr:MULTISPECIES: hypothetical protein [unclassified Ensifer]KQW39277.1 hypothetical protein ASD02_36340 [Ensifer sp. Root1252]KRC62213.1 hypothetical protein ASE32_36305 [Ensifer sp. Root231]KRC91103.1 hypothetical protein ASE47_36330 [Ensifer sp. Root258]
MASVVEELKAKLAELEAQLESIRAEALILEGQKAAVLTVIKVFDPSAMSEVRQQTKKRDRSTPGRRVTDLLKGRDVRRGVLELLRDSEEPVLAGDLSKRFAEREGFATEIDGIGPNLAGRFSGLLERMEQAGLVRSSDAPNGRRRLWEIAR